MAPTIRTLAKYKSDQYYYSVDFFGEDLTVTLTKTPSDIRRWIRDVSASTGHHIGISQRRRVTTVLRIVSSYAWEHRVSSSSSLTVIKRVPDIIPRFLTDPNTTFVGSGNSQDAKRLARTRYQLEIGELLDARMYVVDSQGTSLRGRSFEEIVEKCMGFRGVKLDRGISRSDWSVEYLGNDQILQVSVDAYVCFKLGVSARL
ncbi:hypothetical protein YC2023_012850 [Brassica napus]